jgi:phosphotransferase system enzyme I (PtsI)
MRIRKGIPVSPGVAVGTAYCIDDIFVAPRATPLEQTEVTAELRRFNEATEKTATDLRALYQKVASQVGEKEAAIFRAHETILRDPSFRNKVRNFVIEQRQSAQAALHHVLDEYSSLFAKTTDNYLRERLADVRDVVVRLSSHLTEALTPGSDALPGPIIIVASEVLPSQALTLGNREVSAFVTESGGGTSHAAILARSRGVPAVSGVEGILKLIKTGDTIIVDGRDGHIVLEPDTESLTAYRKLQREFFDLKDQLAENRDVPAVSGDGEALELLANVNNLADVKAAAAMGAAGVGLYRTEYLFLTHPDVPSEDEQFETYRQVIAAAPNHRVTIRTLDLGGDKTIAYLGHNREANPFMGWRSIRLSFEHPEFFLSQIRAVLRAAAPPPGETYDVKLMFPMITTIEEIRKVRTMVTKAYRQLKEKRKKSGPVKIGMMVEVPAAAISIENFLEHVDFVSIGSNDLVQYLMAADRDNPKVSHLCRPLSPPVLKVLAHVIETCDAAEVPVTLCGEMAGAPRAFLLLFAMGLRSFSMSPAFIPSVKELASRLDLVESSRILRNVLRLKTSTQIMKYMADQIEELCPEVKLMDL